MGDPMRLRLIDEGGVTSTTKVSGVLACLKDSVRIYLVLLTIHESPWPS